MDLSTLPMEMIASVAKYLDYVHLVRLRKTSCLLNTVAKRYGIGKRLPVSKCLFDFTAAKITLHFCESVDSVYNLSDEWKSECEFNFRSTGRHELLYKIKIRTVNFKNGDLCKATLQALQTHAEAFKFCSSIEFEEVNFAVTKEEFTSFLNIFPMAEDLLSFMFDKNYYILNFEVFSSRKWERIRVSHYVPFLCSDLDDHCLERIVANHTALQIPNTYHSFTVQGVFNALKALSSDEECAHMAHWGILDPGDMEPDEAIELFRTIPGIKVHSNSADYLVKFERDDNMDIRFTFGQLF